MKWTKKNVLLVALVLSFIGRMLSAIRYDVWETVAYGVIVLALVFLLEEKDVEEGED